ncbi:MAG: DUF4830 domain-containing protein [Clostridia bacterium]|nr:DUF4830 domain-containing protein [Clostridia bacterium]
MKKYVTVTKKSMAIVFLLTLFVIIVSGQFYAAQHPAVNGRTNAQRVAFIKSLSMTPDDSMVEIKKINIPLKFSDVYKNYNEMQIQSGYDLSRYKGVKATLYTYPVGKINSSNNDEYYVNLIVYNGRIIGGDVSSRNFYGEMKPLIKQS